MSTSTCSAEAGNECEESAHLWFFSIVTSLSMTLKVLHLTLYVILYCCNMYVSYSLPWDLKAGHN